MTAKDSIQKYANNFWKYASNTKGVIAIEDAFINWAHSSDMTIKEFSHVWAKIHDDISTKFGLKKADISFSRTDDILELAELLKNTGVEDVESVLNESLPAGEEALTPEPGPGDSIKDIADETPPGPPPEGGMTEPGLEEGGESPDLKLTESLLL